MLDLSTTTLKNSTQQYSSKLKYTPKKLSQKYPYQSEKAHILDYDNNPIFTSQVHYSDDYIAFTITDVREGKTFAIVEVSKETGKIIKSNIINIPMSIVVDTVEQANDINAIMFTAWLGVAFLEAKYKSKQTASVSKTKATKVQYIGAPPGQVCCPKGTKDCAGSAENALANCPRNCASCYTRCGYDPQCPEKGYHRYVVNPGFKEGLWCCPDTPIGSIKEPCTTHSNPWGEA